MQLGFAGLGAMRRLIVPRLMSTGHEVTSWKRSRDKAASLIAQDIRWADTPRQATENADIIFSIFTDANAVGAVALGPDRIVSGHKPSGIFIGMSTIEPEESRAVASEFAKTGSNMLDGPWCDSPVIITRGKASIMIGGDEAALVRAKPILLAIGPKVTRIDGNGLACQMKIAVNLLLMVQVIVFGEAVALAEKSGVARAVDAILKSVAALPVLGYRGLFDGQIPKAPLADVALQHKDMLLALNVGRTLGSLVPLAAATNEMMNACRGLGINGNDFVVVTASTVGPAGKN